MGYFHLVKLYLHWRYFENTRVFFIQTLNFACLNLPSGANYERWQEDGVYYLAKLCYETIYLQIYDEITWM